MAGFSMELMGQQALFAVLARGGARVVPVVGRVFYEEGNDIMREAKEEIPFRFGIAKGSGRVFLPEVIRDQTTVTLGFGGAASAYVEVLHENRMNRVFRNGKKSKYLEDPLTRATVNMEARMAAKLAEIMGVL